MHFKKAFHSIEQQAIWKALRKQAVPMTYIAVFRSLYEGQTGCVRTDALSCSFDICRESKQGDPVSSLLFIAILENIFRDIKPAWSRKKWGIQLSCDDADGLPNLRFADDVLLVGTSLVQVSEMLSNLVIGGHVLPCDGSPC